MDIVRGFRSQASRRSKIAEIRSAAKWSPLFSTSCPEEFTRATSESLRLVVVAPFLPSGVILLIDNYDSFTWNLVQRLGELNPELEPDRDLRVIRNDQIEPEEVGGLDEGRGPSHIIISPGPCTPNEAGVSGAIINRYAG